MNVWVTIPCHRPYFEKLQRCLETLEVERHRIFVVANGEDPIQSSELPGVHVVQYAGPESFAGWWNLGLDHIGVANAGQPHHALVLNADAYLGLDAVRRLDAVMDHHQLAMVGPDVHGICDVTQEVWINRDAQSPLPKRYCVPGYCFMLRGELGIRVDGHFPGWYGDDDMEWTARRMGGTGLVSGVEIKHDEGGAGAAHGTESRLYFKHKWGYEPWI